MLCLDAPLAALGWAYCLSVDFTKQGLHAVSESNLAALFLSVWIIYLFDRLYDVFRTQRSGILTARHEWARRHPALLATLAAGAAGVLTMLILPELDRSILRAGLGPGIVTLLYYFAFRFSRLHSRFSRRVPWKELMIGSCFAFGIAIAVNPGEIRPGFGLLVVGLALLFSANCLLISRAEGAADAGGDPVAYFAGGRPEEHSRLPERLVLLSVIAGMPVAAGSGFILSTVGLSACGAMTFALSRSGGGEWKSLLQPAADGIQLFPWLLIGGAAIWERLNL